MVFVKLMLVMAVVVVRDGAGTDHCDGVDTDDVAAGYGVDGGCCLGDDEGDAANGEHIGDW